MKIGFICPNLPGHINPMSALARHLQARGHDVVFLYSSSANGLPCLPGDERDDVNANRPEISKLEGNEALAFYCGIAAKETEAIFKSLPRMLKETGVEALVRFETQAQSGKVGGAELTRASKIPSYEGRPEQPGPAARIEVQR